MLFNDLYETGIQIAKIFWGLWLFPFGYLVFKSDYIPKILGVLLIIAGFGYLIDSFTFFLFPTFPEIGLFTWLGELLYLGEQDNCVFTDFDVIEVTPTRLRAIVQGGPVQEHQAHIKAVTFSELEIVHNDGGYETTIVFDV